MSAPDVQGFQEAQARLNDVLGEDVVFIAFEPKVYGPGVTLDPETGDPFDPIQQPISGGDEIATVLRVTPIEGAAGHQDQTLVGPSGVRDVLEPVFSVMATDIALITDAIFVDHNGERYHITDVKNDDDRYLVFTEAT